MNTKKRTNLLKGERLLYFFIFVLIISNFVGQAFSMAMLSKTNIELESVRAKIKKQVSINESLNMKINELASLDNVEEVASSFGLEYNNNNIKIISE